MKRGLKVQQVSTFIFYAKIIFVLILCLSSFLPTELDARDNKDVRPQVRVPILLYHRFGPTVADSMTVTTPVFEAHLKYLKDNGYTVIPLRHLINFYLGKGSPPPPKSVVIAADDGHKSVYSVMLPLIKKYRFPVTLFIYPSAISNASYAMTWRQLGEIRKTGLCDIQSHTYWHPNFKKDKKKLSPSEYEKFADMQLKKSKEKLEKKLGIKVDMLAWPFGIYDEWLEKRASGAGYIAAFTIERRHTSPSDNIMALPRYIMINADKANVFGRILEGNSPRRNIIY